VYRVHHDPVHAHVELRAQLVLELDRLVHGHLLRQRDGHHTSLGRVAQERVDPLGVAAHGAHARDPRVRARRPQHREPVPGCRCIDDRDVVSGLAGARLELGEVPDLAHRHELGQARRCCGEVLEQPAPAEESGQGARLELVAQPVLLRTIRIDGLEMHPLRQGIEHAAEALLLGNLAHHGALALSRRRQPEGGRDGRLSDAALARHEDEPLVQ
jgi:hypothetical protein